MSQSRLSKAVAAFDSMLAAWVLCVMLLGVTWMVATRTLPDEPAFERAAIAKLELLEQTPPDALRVVVIGNSRSNSAFGHQPGIEAVLQASGVAVAVADLSSAGVQFNTVAPLIDNLFAAQPDVVVLQPGAIPELASPTERSLVGRARVWLGLQGAVRIRPPGCSLRGPGTFDEITTATLRRYAESIDLGPARQFIDRAERDGIAVYLVEFPRSGELLAEISDVVATYRGHISEHLGSFDHVTIGPLIELLSLDFYCDYSHLNHEGQDRFLEEWVPTFTAYLAQIATEQ